MPTLFDYKALTPEGEYKNGQMTAESKANVTEYLADQQLIPISVNANKSKLSLSMLGFFKKLDYEALILFTNNLSTTYRAGIPILRALSIIKIGQDGGHFNQVIEKIRYDVQSGKSLSQAMHEHRDFFSQVYVNSIAAGEESGKLDEILDELSSVLEKELEISRQVKSGLRYPMIVIGVIAAAFVVLMAYVMPKFIDFYGSFDAELPLPSRILISTSNIITGYWPIILVALGLFSFGIRLFSKSNTGRLFIDRTILKLPVFGKLIIKGNIARFSLMFRILFKSGLPIIKSLEILSESMKNSTISLEIKKMEQLFRQGAEADLVKTDFVFMPNLAKQMMAIGLETGSLDEILLEVGNHYTKEVQYTARQLTSIIEPILTLIVAVFVLIMALAIFLPMWNLIKVFNG